VVTDLPAQSAMDGPVAVPANAAPAARTNGYAIASLAVIAIVAGMHGMMGAMQMP
jgi:hypothetical protein